MKKPIVLVLLFLTALCMTLVFGSRLMQPQAASLTRINQVSQANWEKLAQTRILFGHASVGGNVLQGIQELQKQHPEITLNIRERDPNWSMKQPGLVHFFLQGQEEMDKKGENGLAKMDDFFQTLETKIKEPVDIALFKLCWADFRPSTDPTTLFEHYKTVMTKLMRDFPQTTFVPVTTPLVAEPSGMMAAKNVVKRLFGMPPSRLADNVKINQLNDLIRAEYANKAPIFDLAGLESTLPDGKRQIFSEGGKDYFALVPGYTDDMGHLNESGRQIAAEELLVLLTQIANQH